MELVKDPDPRPLLVFVAVVLKLLVVRIVDQILDCHHA